MKRTHNLESKLIDKIRPLRDILLAAPLVFAINNSVDAQKLHHGSSRIYAGFGIGISESYRSISISETPGSFKVFPGKFVGGSKWMDTLPVEDHKIFNRPGYFSPSITLGARVNDHLRIGLIAAYNFELGILKASDAGEDMTDKKYINRTGNSDKRVTGSAFKYYGNIRYDSKQPTDIVYGLKISYYSSILEDKDYEYLKDDKSGVGTFFEYQLLFSPVNITRGDDTFNEFHEYDTFNIGKLATHQLNFGIYINAENKGLLKIYMGIGHSHMLPNELGRKMKINDRTYLALGANLSLGGI